MSSPRHRPLLICTSVALAAAAFALPASAAHAAGGGAAPTFAAHRVLGLGSGVTDPRSLAAGDLDDDGRADLVAGSASGGTGAISVLRGTGAGAFAAPLGSPYGLATSGGAGAIALGDLNGDGRLDVAATIGSGTADDDEVVPLAGDGAGGLTPGAPVTVAGTSLAGIALADLDGDGDLDALTASTTAVEGDQLGILENGGGAGLAFSSGVGAASTLLATAVAAGDLDGDGTPDALVVSRNAGTGSAWVATANSLTLTPGTAVPLGADPVAVALADVDGDGDLDGVVVDGSAPLVTLLRNDGAGGLTATALAVDGLAAGSGITTGDLNGDGAVDLVVTDGASGVVGVLSGDGTGAFAAPAWFQTGTGPRSPVVADLTGDGLPDIATADASDDALSLVRNAGAAAPDGALAGAFGTETVGRTGTAHAVTITNTGNAPLKVTGIGTDGDAADDFLVTGDGCTGAVVASGGASCVVRLRFAPSAAGVRAAVLRVRSAGGGSYDLAVAGTGAAEAATPATTTSDDGSTSTSGSTTTTTTATTVATPAATPAAVAKTTSPQVQAKKKSTRLILTLSQAKLTAKSGAPVAVGFALGRAASLVLRVKHGAKTVEIVRGSGREGRGSLKWDGRLGAKAAPKGTYRFDLYAVAADGRAARASISLTVK